jgi:AcrR family transcriptional regulator
LAKPAAGAAPLDGNAVRTERTRARILAQALLLFNERGAAHVTSGAIASVLDISPGNLYYHFRNKDAIVEELFHRFEERVGVEPIAPESASEAIEDLWLYLHLMLEAIWEYRFLYFGLDDLVGRNRRLRAHFIRIVDRKSATVEALCESLVHAGAMRATPGEIRTIARNVLVVSTYWLSFQSLQVGDETSAQASLGQGAYQVMALVAPYLGVAARRHLERLGRRYLDA